MLRQEESYELSGSSVIRTTQKAVLVRLDDLTEIWIPRSVCLDGDDIVDGDEDISVQAWWAEQEDISV